MVFSWPGTTDAAQEPLREETDEKPLRRAPAYRRHRRPGRSRPRVPGLVDLDPRTLQPRRPDLRRRRARPDRRAGRVTGDTSTSAAGTSQRLRRASRRPLPRRVDGLAVGKNVLTAHVGEREVADHDHELPDRRPDLRRAAGAAVALHRTAREQGGSPRRASARHGRAVQHADGDQYVYKARRPDSSSRTTRRTRRRLDVATTTTDQGTRCRTSSAASTGRSGSRHLPIAMRQPRPAAGTTSCCYLRRQHGSRPLAVGARRPCSTTWRSRAASWSPTRA